MAANTPGPTPAPAPAENPLHSPVALEIVRQNGSIDSEEVTETSPGPAGADGRALTAKSTYTRRVAFRPADKGEFRKELAVIVMAIFAVLVFAPMVGLALGKISSTDLDSVLQVVFSGMSGLTGAVLGFYFSSQQAKSSPTAAAGSKSTGNTTPPSS